MSKNYDDYKPIYVGSPRRRTNSALTFIKLAIVFMLLLALVVSAVYFVHLHKGKGGIVDNGSETTAPIETVPPGDETVPPEETDDGSQKVDGPITNGIDLEAYTQLKVEKSVINNGSLILVNSNYKVVYPDADDLVNLFNEKTDSYQASTRTMLIHKDIIDALNEMMDDFVEETDQKDVIVWTSYRDKARQTQVYNEYVAQHGEEAAIGVVAKPDESDHNTGLGVALRVFRGGLSYQFSEVEGYEWIAENCHKYGFVERYPNDKKDVTGLDYSTSFYLRYVGKPHAEIMKNNNLCLEEYLTLLKDYEFGKNHYEYRSADGKKYEVYYVKCVGEADSYDVPVPKDKNYTISGDNIGGFIVSVEK